MGNEETVFQTPEERDEARAKSDTLPKIAGYQLTTTLGEGSFGRVFSGMQERTGQPVAVKVFRPERIRWDYLEHELSKLVQVAKHPNVVTLLDADLRHDPPYCVMPLLKGSLAEQESTSVEQVVGWLEDVSQALVYMHGKGILHCDLKPSNILLDEEGRARLVDFGQARSVDDTSAGLGTFGYMSPEQAQVQAQPDGAWDVYGFGATAYRLLGGRCPRLTEEDRTELTQSVELQQRLSRYQEILSERDMEPLQTLNQEVDEDLAEIVSACLELDSANRPASPHQVTEDLTRRRTREPLLCKKPWTARYRIVRFLSRPLAATALLAAVIFPLFVNSYLTIKAQVALRDQVFLQVQLVNRMAAELARQGHPLPEVNGFRHSRIGPTELEALVQEATRPEGGFYEREGVRRVGVWTRLGDTTLLTERDTDQALASSRDILNKNRLLNLMILAVAGITILVILRADGQR